MIIKKELPHFQINRYYGGSQSWLMDPWMRLGGCGALAAVDSCIFLAKYHKIKALYPDIQHLNKSAYCSFAMEMKPYLRPRYQGINKLDLYMDGFRKFLEEKRIHNLQMEGYSMGSSKEMAFQVLKERIDKNILVPVLLLNPVSKEWKEYQWHWFLLNAYQVTEQGIHQVKAVTYGTYEWLSWDGFWDEHDESNGGMILYSL